MSSERRGPSHARWAELRFAIIGPLLASPPARGELAAELETLAKRSWTHPISGEPLSFSVPTIERWFYLARSADADRVAVLRKQVRKDAGTRPSLSTVVRDLLRAQYDAHRSWSYQLHADNLRVVCDQDSALGPCPSYPTIRRFMKENGLVKQRRVPGGNRPGAIHAREHRASTEVRSYEATHVHGLWHTDFHDGSRKVLTKAGAYKTPQLFGVLDDVSRVGCHAQWYLDEEAETFCHGLGQAFQKRGLPTMLMSDGGSAMKAAETQAGLTDLSIVHWPTLHYSPHQNGKQEVFWAQVEGRLMPMLEGVPELTLALLNEATQAWLELEYNRKVHSELGTSPVQRMLAGPSVARACPSSDAIRRAFRVRERRTQRRSDGTISICGVRFEIPSRLRHLEQLIVRYPRWDLSSADVVDAIDPTVVITTIYPLDKQKNADGKRRAVTPVSEAAPPKSSGMAPLLRKLIVDHRSAGLPPAYLPKHDVADADGDTHEDSSS